jgi:flagellar hook-associated protein 1 FlgK
MTTSSLFAQLDLGKRSLAAQQAGTSVAGHNIANIHNENFSRQRVQLDPQHPSRGRFGAGVDLKGVDRLTDRFLNQRLISEQSRGGTMDARVGALRRLENLMNESEGFGLREALNQFWSSWGAVANNPEDQIFRTELTNAANTLARRMSTLGNDLQNLRQEFNGRLAERVNHVNELAQHIASLNEKVQQVDRGQGESNDLRDQREATLKELSKLVQIDWFENEHNTLEVTVGNGFPLVHGRTANALEASYSSGEAGYFTLRGIDFKGISRDLTGEIKGGELPELVAMRDETVVRFSNKLDQFASELAFQVNRVHSTGTGLNVRNNELHSTFALKADARAAPLPFLKDGKFRIHLVDPGNEFLETYEIPVNAGKDTLDDIVNRINSTVGDPKILQARVNADGSVSIEAKGAQQFVMGQDDTDFAVLMGFNNFFETLQGARDFRLSNNIVGHPERIAAGRGLLPGDNSVAREIQNLQNVPTMEGRSVTFDEFYNGITADLGLSINRAQNDQKNQQIIIDQFQKLRDEVSSVNMDEEVADMVQFQRGFDAAAKFVNTVDEMTKAVINM